MWRFRSVGKLNVGGGVQWAEPEAAGVSRTMKGAGGEYRRSSGCVTQLETTVCQVWDTRPQQAH